MLTSLGEHKRTSSQAQSTKVVSQLSNEQVMTGGGKGKRERERRSVCVCVGGESCWSTLDY